MSTLQRLLLAFGVVVALTAVQGILISIRLDALAEKTTLASTKPVDSVDSARAAWSIYGDASSYLTGFLEMTKPEDSAAALKTFNDLIKELDSHLDRLAASAISPAAVRDAQAVRGNVTRWVDSAHILLGAAPAAAIPAPHIMTQIETNIRNALDRLVELTLRDAADVRSDIAASAASTGRLNVLTVIIGLLVGSSLAVFSSLSVTRPIKQIGDVLRELDGGNKAVEIPFIERRDEIGDTARAAKSFRDNLIHMEMIEAERRDAQSRADRHIRFLAHHDALTGLPNRAFFAEKLDQAVAGLRDYGDPFAVFMLDLDKFKNVNDTLGHPAGDQLLRETAQRLKSSLRDLDVLARIGGDEFAIIQPLGQNLHQSAAALGARIVHMMSDPYDIDGNIITAGTSIGIALAPADAGACTDLLKMADLALYAAKSSGRNSFRFFDVAMLEGVEQRRQMEKELRVAISNGELELHYQPLIDVKTRRPAGFEALVRWHSPGRGVVMPDHFIPLAEETGLIVPLGAWVLRQACKDAANWPSHIKVAVNLSPVQLMHPDFLQTVVGALVESSLPSKRLELEITETALFKNDVDCLKLIRRLKQLGVSIAIDDFGTGYSSLSYLTTFPFDKIKIDRSFTSNLTTRTDCAAIVSAVLALGRSLNTETVAEGVESEQQFSILRASGVTLVQGYLFGRPCPVSDLVMDDIAAKPPVDKPPVESAA